MPKKLTTEEFILKARNVHGDKYVYSKVNYINAKTNVTIICPIHGEFEQSPLNHLSGKGCPKCGINKRSDKRRFTKEEFLSRSKYVWGENTFDYNKIEYVNSQTKVTIICKKHGLEFKQQPKHHLKGQNGCPQCLLGIKGQHKRGYWTYERCYKTAKKYKWLSEFRKDIFNCYDTCIKRGYLKDFTWLKRHYSEDEDNITAQKHCIYKYEFPDYNTVYIGLSINVKKRYITGHSKKGPVYNFCKTNNLVIPKPQIIEDNLTLDEAKVREGYWIGYYRSQGYILLNKAKAGSVGMLCKVKTGNETVLFIQKARKVHGEKYVYDKVEYINSQTNVTITCPVHGDFEQQANNHIQGNGCPKCGKEKIAEKRTKWTYETCKSETKKYKSRGDFQKCNMSAYQVSRVNKWLDEFYPKK